MQDHYDTAMVLMLGYPGVGKRTVGEVVAELLDGVLVDNQLINIPLLTLWKWDGKSDIPMEIWDRVGPIRDAVLGTIEDLAPATNSYVFTNVLHPDDEGLRQYDQLRSLAERRDSLFLTVMVDCDVDVQVSRIDNPDRIARLKGSDPEGYRWHRHNTVLFEPPPEDVMRIDTTDIGPRQNAEAILEVLVSRGLRLVDRAQEGEGAMSRGTREAPASVIEEPIVQRTLVRRPRTEVFPLLATAAGLDRWFTTGAELDPQPGGRMLFRWEDWGADGYTGTSVATVVEYRPPEQFTFTWWEDAPTTVSISFEDHPEGCVVTVNETGYSNTPTGRERCLECAVGWGEALTLVKFAAEHGLRY